MVKASSGERKKDSPLLSKHSRYIGTAPAELGVTPLRREFLNKSRPRASNPSRLCLESSRLPTKSFSYGIQLMNPALCSSTGYGLEIPEVDLRRLLQASVRFRPESEITPVQVRYQLQERLDERDVSVNQLRGMADQYSKYVYCKSFGAVLGMSTAKAILADFTSGRHA